ncbi:MAG: hypothetical protein WCT53_00775 [Candidatus Gracilibacteria bacterium]
MPRQALDNNRGFGALLAVLILGVVMTSIAVYMVLLGIDTSRTGLELENSAKAKALSVACAEEGLTKIRESIIFTGTGTLTIGDGSCTYTVINTGGTTRTITSTGTVGSEIRKSKVMISHINPTISSIYWQELADF